MTASTVTASKSPKTNTNVDSSSAFLSVFLGDRVSPFLKIMSFTCISGNQRIRIQGSQKNVCDHSRNEHES